jgi:hypothetical protein
MNEKTLVDTKKVQKYLNPAEKTGIKNFLRKIIESPIATEHKPIKEAIPPANVSYLISVYQISKSDFERVRDFIEKIGRMMSSARTNNEFSLVISIPRDIAVFKKDIIDAYKKQHYRVEILNSYMGDLNNEYMFICWDKFIDSIVIDNIENISTNYIVASVENTETMICD